MKKIKTKSCSHKNWSLAGYPEMMEFELGLKSFEKQPVFKVSSIYEVYCKDCDNFVNLLTGETINHKGLVRCSI